MSRDAKKIQWKCKNCEYESVDQPPKCRGCKTHICNWCLYELDTCVKHDCLEIVKSRKCPLCQNFCATKLETCEQCDCQSLMTCTKCGTFEGGGTVVCDHECRCAGMYTKICQAMQADEKANFLRYTLRILEKSSEAGPYLQQIRETMEQKYNLAPLTPLTATSAVKKE